MINRRNAMIKRKTGIAGKITKKLTITIIGGLAGVILAGTMPQQVQNFADIFGAGMDGIGPDRQRIGNSGEVIGE